jgi:hypothetical protein
VKKIGFLYTNKAYSVYHSLGVAIEMAKFDNYDIHILCTKSNETLVHEYLERFNCSNISVKVLRPTWYFNLPHSLEIKYQWKPNILRKYATFYKTFDVFVFTMYDDLYLKKEILIDSPHIKYICANHGVSNRAYSFDERITAFDFFFLLDNNDVKTRKSLNQLTPDNHVMTGLNKYDLIKDLPLPRLFNNDKPIVIYNPHWTVENTSFHKFGRQILEYFSKSKDYNLIFAPHYLLLARNWSLLPVYHKYKRFDNIIVDSTSQKCNNMTYTRIADFYLGDISSQVYEFLFERAKPCLFLDAHEIVQKDIDKPLSWDLGQVVDEIHDIEKLIKQAFENHKDLYLSNQENRIKQMFDVGSKTSSQIATEAVDLFIKKVM